MNSTVDNFFNDYKHSYIITIIGYKHVCVHDVQLSGTEKGGGRCRPALIPGVPVRRYLPTGHILDKRFFSSIDAPSDPTLKRTQGLRRNNSNTYITRASLYALAPSISFTYGEN